MEHGEEIVITRHDRPVARLVPNAGGIDRTKRGPPSSGCARGPKASRPGSIGKALKADLRAAATAENVGLMGMGSFLPRRL